MNAAPPCATVETKPCAPCKPPRHGGETKWLGACLAWLQ